MGHLLCPVVAGLGASRQAMKKQTLNGRVVMQDLHVSTGELKYQRAPYEKEVRVGLSIACQCTSRISAAIEGLDIGFAVLRQRLPVADRDYLTIPGDSFPYQGKGCHEQRMRP